MVEPIRAQGRKSTRDIVAGTHALTLIKVPWYRQLGYTGWNSIYRVTGYRFCGHGNKFGKKEMFSNLLDF